MSKSTLTNASNARTPTLGDGATIHGYSDSKAATVIAVSKSGRHITLQQDTAKLMNGVGSGEPDALTFAAGGFVGHTSGTQRYEFTPDPNGIERKFSLRDNGQWVQVGQSTKGGTRAIIGTRAHYYDFNF